MKRLWWTSPGSVEALTDEQALDRIERGRDIRPLAGDDAVIAAIREELTEGESE